MNLLKESLLDNNTNKILSKKKFVRLPCPNCKNILPSFTINTKDNLIDKNLICRFCKKHLNIIIELKKNIDYTKINEIQYNKNGYNIKNSTSLDWTRYDPSNELYI